MTTTTPADAKSMRLVKRSLSVLNLVGKYEQGLTLQEIHNRLEIPLGSLHRIASTLVDEEYLFRSPLNKKFYIGQQAKALGGSKKSESYVVPPPKVLIDAAEESGETIFLTQLIDVGITCVSLVEARHSLRLTVDIGKTVPVLNAASARIILAHLDADTVSTIVQSDEGFAELNDPETAYQKLLYHLEIVRAQGYDSCAGELDDGVWAVSAPVFDAKGAVVLGVTLAAAATRVQTEQAKKSALSVVRRAAEALSQENGFITQKLVNPRRLSAASAFSISE